MVEEEELPDSPPRLCSICGRAMILVALGRRKRSLSMRALLGVLGALALIVITLAGSAGVAEGDWSVEGVECYTSRGVEYCVVDTTSDGSVHSVGSELHTAQHLCMAATRAPGCDAFRLTNHQNLSWYGNTGCSHGWAHDDNVGIFTQPNSPLRPNSLITEAHTVLRVCR